MTGLIIVSAFLLVLLMIATSVWLSGLWNAVLTLVILVTSGLVATSYYGPLAYLIAKRAPNVEYSVIAEFLAMWILFVLSYLILRILAELLTRHHLLFDIWTEMIGRSVVSIAGGLVFCSFVLYTLHLAPLQVEGSWHDYFDRGGGAFGLGIDRAWGGYCRYASQGPLKETYLTSGVLAKVGRVYRNSEGDEIVDFGTEYVGRITPGLRFIPRYVPPMDEYTFALARFRVLVAEYYRIHYDAFIREQGDMSAAQVERNRENATQELERIGEAITQSINARSLGYYK
jgi:hypothetical protein